MILNAQQLETLAELAKKHVTPAHLYQSKTSIVEVEFEFPFRYIIASNGRAILLSVP